MMTGKMKRSTLPSTGLPPSLVLHKGDRLIIATHNAGKLKEFRQLFLPFELELVSAGELGLSEPDETGKSFAQNAALKASSAARAANCLALGDDSGLCVSALDGRPGIHTARWTGPDRDFAFGMQRVQDELIKVNAHLPARRRASFNATLCLAAPGGDEALFEGIVEGRLVWPPRGRKGFGFDPMFQPDGHGRTFGQMSAEEKHSWSPGHVGLSHRARAFDKLVGAACDK